MKYTQQIDYYLYSVVTASIFRKNENDAINYTFGSVEQAEDFVKEYIKNEDNIIGYEVQDLAYIPCDKSNPGGQLYQSPLYQNYVNLEDLSEIKS